MFHRNARHCALTSTLNQNRKEETNRERNTFPCHIEITFSNYYGMTTPRKYIYIYIYSAYFIYTQSSHWDRWLFSFFGLTGQFKNTSFMANFERPESDFKHKSTFTAIINLTSIYAKAKTIGAIWFLNEMRE
jgi:hypothetical protein